MHNAKNDRRIYKELTIVVSSHFFVNSYYYNYDIQLVVIRHEN